MTIESEIIKIVRLNNLRHLSAIATSDGLVKVSIQERKPPRVKGFDPKEYYRNNKERIRKYQADYYLKIKGRKVERVVTANSYIPTPKDLAKAMAYLYSQKGMEIGSDELKETATQVIQFFGFEKEVVGNHLEQDEIAVMYQLEDIGLINTKIEEYNLSDGKPWRVNYFILNIKRIKECSSNSIEEKTDEVLQIYESLP